MDVHIFMVLGPRIVRRALDVRIPQHSDDLVVSLVRQQAPIGTPNPTEPHPYSALPFHVMALPGIAPRNFVRCDRCLATG